MQSQHRDIAYMDVGTYDLSGTKIMTVHPEHKKPKHMTCFGLMIFTSSCKSLNDLDHDKIQFYNTFAIDCAK